MAQRLPDGEDSYGSEAVNTEMQFANDGIFAKIAFDPYFQNTTLLIIVFNAVWIGIDVQANHPIYKTQRDLHLPLAERPLPLEPYSTIVENLFCLYFTGELLVRFLSFKRKADCRKDGWFVFDGLLVLFMVIETWILVIVGAILGGGSDGILSKFSALRLLRLLRLTRMARIMKAVPELLTLVKGMISATRAVSFILMFLVLCMYVFAIVFTAQLGYPDAPEYRYPTEFLVLQSEEDPTAVELFGSLGDSMMTLFTRGMLADNLAQTLQAIKDRGGDIVCEDPLNPSPIDDNGDPNCVRSGGSYFLLWAFILFMIISAFCLLNMLIGVLCEVIQDSAEKENESMQIQELKTNMAQAFNLIDTSKDGLITPSEWKKMKMEKTVRASMASLGVEEQHMEERLDQMQESLFGSLEDPDEMEEVDKIQRIQSSSSASDASRHGLTFEQFISKVVEIRPDTPASALDIEILRVRVEREEKMFNARIDFIEQALANVNASPGAPVAPSNNKGPQAAPDPKIASANAWLLDVPTEVLFKVLNSRAPPELGQPKIL